MSAEETKASFGPNPAQEEVLHYLGKHHSEISQELVAKIRCEWPYKCGWFKRRVMSANMDNKNCSDDEEVAILINDGREVRDSWGEAKKWLAENEATTDTM